MIKKIICIGGVARSGTSWIGQIINSSPQVCYRFQPLFSYEFKGRVNEDSTPSELRSFFEDLFKSNTPFLTQQDKVKAGTYPKFTKSAPDILCFKENKYQTVIEPMLRKVDNFHFIGIIRNPNATIYSWTQNPSEFPKGSDIMKEWRFGQCKNKGVEDYFGYYKWKEVANLYLDLEEKYGDRVTIIHYDQFIKNPIKESKFIFQRIGIPFDEQTLSFLKTSSEGKDQSYYSVFRGNIDHQIWKKELNEYIQLEIEADIMNTRLERFNK